MSKRKKGSGEARRDPNRAPAAPLPSPTLAATATAAPDRRAWAVVLLPALAALAAFAPVLRNQFVDDWDDNLNILDNPGITGLDWAHIRWALTTYQVGVYQPLGWIFFEAQYVLWGLAPWGYHLTSLVLYVAEAVALYALTVVLLVRCRAIAAIHGPWPIHLGAGLAIGLFVAHPLRDEVVAWASGQPYLPCALFATLTVLAYLHAHPEGRPPRLGWAIAALPLFVAAMMSKAVAVTLPVLLLILDFYPLRRLGRRGVGRVVAGPFSDRASRWAGAEKLAYFALSGVFVILNSRARDHAQLLAKGHVIEQGSLIERIVQACYGVVFYLAKTVWPFEISAIYVLPPRIDWTEPRFALSIVLVAVVSVTLFLLRRARPAWLAAWLSYLVILAPNSGLRRIGAQIVADRYSYMAMLGLMMLVAAGLARLMTARNRAIAPACLATSLTILVALTALSWRQCTFWRNSIALWQHALEFTVIVDPNFHTSLGAALVKTGDVEASLDSFKQALHYQPDHVQAHAQMGRALTRLGRYAEAEAHLSEAVRRRTDDDDVVHDSVATAPATKGKSTEAEAHPTVVVRPDPDKAEIYDLLGAVLVRQGRLNEAESYFAEAVRLQSDNILARKDLGEVLRREPGHQEGRLLLGDVLLKQGKLTEAEAQFSEVLRSNPANTKAQTALTEIAHRRDRLPSP